MATIRPWRIISNTYKSVERRRLQAQHGERMPVHRTGDPITKTQLKKQLFIDGFKGKIITQKLSKKVF